MSARGESGHALLLLVGIPVRVPVGALVLGGIARGLGARNGAA